MGYRIVQTQIKRENQYLKDRTDIVFPAYREINRQKYVEIRRHGGYDEKLQLISNRNSVNKEYDNDGKPRFKEAMAKYFLNMKI